MIYKRFKEYTNILEVNSPSEVHEIRKTSTKEQGIGVLHGEDIDSIEKSWQCLAPFQVVVSIEELLGSDFKKTELTNEEKMLVEKMKLLVKGRG